VPACDLCSERSGVEAWSLVAATLCAPCRQGEFGDRLSSRSLWIQELSTRADPDGPPSNERRCQLSGAWDRAPELRAHLIHEGVLEKTKKIFTRELQVGEPRFDDSVYIESDTKEALGKLLADERVRDTLLELFADLDGGIEFRDKVISVDATDVDPDRRQELRVLLALAMSHLDRVSADAGFEPRGERNPFPRLGWLLSHRTRVRYLRLSDSALHDLVPLAQLDAQQSIDGFPLSKVVLERLQIKSGSLAPVGQLYELESLVLRKLGGITDLQPLAGLRALRTLVVRDCPVEELSFLYALEALESVELDRDRFSTETLADLRHARPTLDITLA
jgi:hypothetical protein